MARLMREITPSTQKIMMGLPAVPLVIPEDYKKSITQLIRICTELFSLRGNLVLKFEPLINADRSFQGGIRLTLNCNHFAEAALANHMLEEFLNKTFRIPYRSASKRDIVHFIADAGKVQMTTEYHPEDYLKIQLNLAEENSISLTIKDPVLFERHIEDALLCEAFINPAMDLYHYTEKKYQIKNTSTYMLENPELNHGAYAGLLRNPKLEYKTEKKIGYKAILYHPKMQHEQFSATLLFITRTYKGMGNYNFARSAIESLCKKMPNVKINWILITDSDVLPPMENKPRHLTCYTSDAFWKIFSIIRALSLEADLIANIPNDFLTKANEVLVNTPLILPKQKKTIMITISEYNHRYSSHQLPGQNMLNLKSGINAGQHSLGLIKPIPLIFPETIDDKRTILCRQHSNIAQLFVHEIDAPLYFGYAYQPSSTEENPVLGLEMKNLLALFVAHAKRAEHKSIKVVLPVDLKTLEATIAEYPTIFVGCSIHFTLLGECIEISDGGELFIDIFNLFPLPNKTFRSLMDYAAAFDTPIAVTGDQSFLELFFTVTDGCVFIYQLLAHKKHLFSEIKYIATENNLNTLLTLIKKMDSECYSEGTLNKLALFIISSTAQLKFEFKKLQKIINLEPDLADSLTNVIVESVAVRRMMLEEDMDVADAIGHPHASIIL